jgi:hypothetical protein
MTTGAAFKDGTQTPCFTLEIKGVKKELILEVALESALTNIHWF